jgi:oxygen-independent coproporphyrinogen-3 oxidase
LSLDLIYAWPGQKVSDLISDLQKLDFLAPEHLSAYTLSLEPGSALTKAVAAGEIISVGEDLQLEMMCLLEDNLDKNGLYRYEVSNFSRSPDRQSQHNLAYWQLKDFIGLGAGACGGWRCRQSAAHWAERYTNTPDPVFYMRQLSASPDSEIFSAADSSVSWFTGEVVDLASSFSEALMMGLRLRAGIDLGLFASEYGAEKVAEVVSRAQLLHHEGLVELADNQLRITAQGLHLTDAVTCRLLSF